MADWPTLQPGEGYPLVDYETGEFLSAAVKAWLEGSFIGSADAIVDKFTMGDPASVPRNPFRTHAIESAALSGTDDFVAHLLRTDVTGDFTGVPSTNDGWVWGVNVYTYVPPGGDNGAGIEYLSGALIEASLGGDDFTGTVWGLMAEAAYIGVSAGGTAENMTSLFVANPKRKDGATAGDADYVYGIYVAEVAPGSLGSIEAFSVFVDGGISRFEGPVQAYGGVSAPGTEGVYVGSRHLTENGTALEVDGEPVVFQTEATITAAGGFTYAVNKVRRQGTTVTLSFVADGATAANTVIGTLPVGYRPSQDVYAAGSCYAGAFALASYKIGTNGNITAIVVPGSTTGVQASIAFCL